MSSQLPGQTTETSSGAQAAAINSQAVLPTTTPLVTAASSLPSGPTGETTPVGSAIQPVSTPPAIRLAQVSAYANNYARGQCTWYVASRRPIPSGWGNANNWYRSAVAAGWPVGNQPALGAIAWTAADTYGHVALVEDISADGTQVYLSEMNYQGLWVRSTRWANTSSFRYIY